jgi:hypothetical protein
MMVEKGERKRRTGEEGEEEKREINKVPRLVPFAYDQSFLTAQSAVSLSPFVP